MRTKVWIAVALVGGLLVLAVMLALLDLAGYWS
jgi:hypothetical protein